MWRHLSEQAKNVKIFVSHMNCHLEMTSLEEDFNNQAAGTTCSVGASQPLPPGTPVICQQAHAGRGHGGRDGSGARSQGHRLLLTEADLAVITTECPVCQQQRRPTESPARHRPQGDQPALVAGRLAWTALSWKGQRFVPTGTGAYSGCRFAFSVRSASAQTPSPS